MGYIRGWLAVNLKHVDRIPILGLINSDILKEFYGKRRVNEIEAYKTLDVDLIYTHGVKRNIKPRKERKLGTGSFTELEDDFPYTDLFPIAYRGLKLARTITSDQLWVVERPFKSYDELIRYLRYNFDPLNWEKRSFNEIVENYKYSYERLQRPLKDTTLVAGEIYLTLFTFFLVHLGHKFTLLLLKRNPGLFEEVAEKYSSLVKIHAEAWARVGIKVFVAHDDIAAGGGPMISPELFEEHVAPFYSKIWKPLLDRKIKVLFVSDGNYLPLIDVLIRAGVSGFKVNWDARLSRKEMKWIIERYGGKYVLSFGPRYVILEYGSLKSVEEEAKWFIGLIKNVKGFFLSNVTGNSRNVKKFWSIWLRECWLS